MEYHQHCTPDENQLGKLLTLLEHAGFGYDLSDLTHSGCVERRAHNFILYAYKKAPAVA
jgi:hypothetical protein